MCVRWSRRPYAKPEIWNWPNLNSESLFPESSFPHVIIISPLVYYHNSFIYHKLCYYSLGGIDGLAEQFKFKFKFNNAAAICYYFCLVDALETVIAAYIRMIF